MDEATEPDEPREMTDEELERISLILYMRDDGRVNFYSKEPISNAEMAHHLRVAAKRLEAGEIRLTAPREDGSASG